MTDPGCLRLFNIILNKSFRSMNLFPVKSPSKERSYFNPSAKHSLVKHKLEVWPGYITRWKLFFFFNSWFSEITFFAIFLAEVSLKRSWKVLQYLPHQAQIVNFFILNERIFVLNFLKEVFEVGERCLNNFLVLCILRYEPNVQCITYGDLVFVEFWSWNFEYSVIFIYFTALKTERQSYV